MQKVIIIGFLSLFILSACLRATVQFPETLSCEETANAADLLTPDTKLIFEGTEARKYADKSVEFCKTHQPQSLRDCISRDNEDDRHACIISLGIQAKDSTVCGKNLDCLIGYAIAHPNKDCTTYDKKVLQNACFFVKTYISRERKYCDFVEIKTWKDETCKKAIDDPSSEEKFMECYINRYKCLWGISDQTSDVSICDSMEDSFEKDICYMSYAIKTSNRDICNKVKGIDWPRSPTLCQEVVGQPFPEKYKENGLFQAAGL